MQFDEKEVLGGKESTMFIWFLLVFLAGLGLRLWRLGEMSFTLAEAQLAQGAWQMAAGDAAGLASGNISYAGLSALLFRVFEPGFFFARLFPVLFGSSLILIPWFWRDMLGKKAAFVLTIGLAIDPILLSFSRQVVTPIFVLAGISWALTALKIKRPVLAGSMLALAFLGGYAFWVVALVGIVAFLLWRKPGKGEIDLASFRSKTFLLPFVTGLIVSLVMISSAFLLCTEGFGGIGAGLVELIQIFGSKYDIPIYQPIMAAIAYSILPLFFLIWGVLEDLRKRQPIKNLPFLIGWALSVVMSLLLGRRDEGMLVFAAVFAWLRAAEGILKTFEQAKEKRGIVLAITLFQVVILVYLQMVCGRFTTAPADSPDFRFAFLSFLAGILLLVISTILVGMGWSSQVGVQALKNSLLVMLIMLTLGLGFRSTGSQQESNSLSLLAGPVVLPNKDVESVVNEIDREGRADKTEITYDLGNLEQHFSWFFREQVDWKRSKNVLQADLMLSEAETDFTAADAYRGRNVVLFRQIDKQVVKPSDFLKTLLGEPLPLVSQNGVLWVRVNLFTGAN